jgi:G3E family GTPase
VSDRLPLFIVTGFLGSGKTTLLQRLLREEGADATGIVVNEFGEVGLDHTLLVHAEEHIELVDGGCICCARRSDIGRSIHDLVVKARRGGRRALDRLVIETSGLADPAPIVSFLGKDPWMRANVELAGVICVLDGVNAERTLAAHPTARRQLAVADTVLVTKRDMRFALGMETLTTLARDISPDCQLRDTQDPDFGVEAVFRREGPLSSYRQPMIADDPDHLDGWSSFVLPLDGAVDWPAFTLWLSALLHAHGDRILRVKGMVRTSSSRDALVIHGVQHVMHPPRHMPLPDAGDLRPYLVFITQGVTKEAVEASVRHHLAQRREAA